MIDVLFVLTSFVSIVAGCTVIAWIAYQVAPISEEQAAQRNRVDTLTGRLEAIEYKVERIEKKKV